MVEYENHSSLIHIISNRHKFDSPRVLRDSYRLPLGKDFPLDSPEIKKILYSIQVQRKRTTELSMYNI